MSVQLGTTARTPSLSPTHQTHKRPYKKSTHGCRNCKARKIKCDETLPCAGCQKRYIDPTTCQYDVAPTEKRQSRSTVSKNGARLSVTLLNQIEQPIAVHPVGISDCDRILDLRLLHYYTKTTCPSQNLNDMVPLLCHPMWEIDIPQMAFSNEIVLNALLGLSAIHLFATNPQDHSIEHASRLYMDKALTKYRSAVAEVNSQNGEPILVAACIIAHHTWLSAHSRELKRERYTPDLQTFHMCNGIRALITGTMSWMEKYAVPGTLSRAVPPFVIYSHRFMDSALADLRDLSTAFSSAVNQKRDDKDVYRQVAEDLVYTYSMVATIDPDIVKIEQQVVTFLHRLPPRFIQLLEQEEPVPMALLARNIVLFSFASASNAWWVHGSGPHKVANQVVWGVHGLLSPQSEWMIEWPLKVLQGEITLGPD